MNATVAIYVSAIVSANLLVAVFGPWVSPINAFVLIGLDLVLRDRLHDAWQGKNLWPKMLALIAVSGLLSWGVNPAAGKIAAASAVAFAASNLVDGIVYHVLRNRSFTVRCNGSNAAGAVIDSLVFPTLAFGGPLPGIVALQIAAKVAGGFVWARVLRGNP